MKSALSFAGLTALALSYASQAQATILPPNDLYLQDNINFAANMTQAEFNAISNGIIDKYKPIVQQIHGGNLTARNDWANSTVNASASQSGSTWIINMYGGLARRPEVTPDGFAMVVCHELGHHLAGFPFYEGDDWASSEGQSDYFAAQSCAKFIWGAQTDENAKFRTTAPAIVKTKCDAAYTNVNQQNLCYRTEVAGKSLATLLGALGGEGLPRFETPDTSRVSSTYTAHPEAQCRLDTYVAGSLCNATWDNKIIPGKFTSGGNDTLNAERDAAKYSCTGSGRVSARPLCWFKPRI